MSMESFGDRQKKYEACTATTLFKGCPKIIRLDGKGFSTYLKTAKKPYDKAVIDALIVATQALIKEIGGSARFAFIASDEISIVINDRLSIGFDPWFGNQVQKMTSVAASVMTAHFNAAYSECRTDAKKDLAYFDARVFIVPDEMEMTNNIIWRQQDTTRNSISQYGRSMFSHKEMNNKPCSELQEMMFSKGFNWNDAPVWTKQGVIIYKEKHVEKAMPICPVCGHNTQVWPSDGQLICHRVGCDHAVCQSIETGGKTGGWKTDWDIPTFSKTRQYLLDLYKAPEPTIDL